MRMEFIQCKCRKTAWRRAPWAAAIAAVDGGYLAFESAAEHATWSGQR